MAVLNMVSHFRGVRGTESAIGHIAPEEILVLVSKALAVFL